MILKAFQAERGGEKLSLGQVVFNRSKLGTCRKLHCLTAKFRSGLTGVTENLGWDVSACSKQHVHMV